MSKLFRKEALATLATPEKLDTLLQVTNPVAWLALLAAALLTVASLAWAFLGSLAVTVSAPGVLIPEQGLISVPSLWSGVVTEVVANDQQVVRDHSVVVRMKPSNAGEGDENNRVEITTAKGGQVLGLYVREGQFVEQGQNVAILTEPGAAMECVAYFPFNQGDKLSPGMAVRVFPSNAREDVYGALEGTLTRIEPYPTTREEMTAVLADGQLVEFFLGGNPYQEAPVEARIQLKRDLSDPSTYTWTSGHGPKRQPVSGTSCRIEVVTEYVRPAELAIPKIRDFFGAGDGQD